MDTPKKEITQEQWDKTVEQWNRKNAVQREEIRSSCRKDGHAWRRFPIEGKEICVRCCSYREASQ